MPQDAQKGSRRFRMYRSSKSAEDPLAGIRFDPPDSSTELRDALKLAYPGSPSHEARVGDAIIDYPIEERRNERTSSCRSTEDADPDEVKQESESKGLKSDSTLIKLEDTCNQAVGGIKSSVRSGKATALTSTRAEKGSSHSPSWKSMTSVWNPFNRKISKSGRSMPMTDEEKAEYRKIRKQGACSDCKKRKRKCNDDHYNAQANSSTASLVSERPRNRRKADNDSLAPIDEIPKEEPLPLPDLGTNFGNDEAFSDFFVEQIGIDLNDPSFYAPSELDTASISPPNSLTHKSSNLSQLSGSENSMFALSLTTASTAPSIYEVLFQDEVLGAASSSVPPPIPPEFAHLFSSEPAGSETTTKPDPADDTAWAGSWDQLFDASLAETRDSLEGLSMGPDIQ